MKILRTFSLILPKDIGCGYSLEVPQRGTSKEFPQPMFFMKNQRK